MTREQRAEILQVYLTNGFTAAVPLITAHGISPKNLSKWARLAGHKGRRGRELGVWKTSPIRPRIRTARQRKMKPAKMDPRWQWAIERGEVRI